MELFFKNWNRPSLTATPKVLLIGYEKFRTLVNKGINSEFYRGLVYPGPDLLVCDESHRLKNEDMNLYKALEPVNTKRRLFLTGTLFQNDLFEYRCCVNFVQPILFSRNAFDALFKYPIENGSTIDMHENAVGESRRRAHVLYRLVEPHVHRRGHVPGVLPERKDFVVFIRLSDTQCGLYKGYLDYLMEPTGEPRAKKAKRGYFLNYHFLRKIWTHPRLLLAFENKLEENADFKLTEVLSHFRADGLLHDVQSRAINLSGKLTFVLSLIAECVKERQNDKILIFTQFIESIVLLKEALSESLQWCEGEEFFVISGEIPPMDRKQIESMFNDKNGVVKLVIFSTRAGCVGTNFQAANRVVIFDVSANPAIDEQATYRAYRIGQQKPVFVYRLVVEQTLEDRDYRRQVDKISIGKRVENEHQVERFYTTEELTALYKTFNPSPKRTAPLEPSGDNILDTVGAVKNGEVVVMWERHDVKFEHREEFALTSQEKHLAWAEFGLKALSYGISVDAMTGFSDALPL